MTRHQYSSILFLIVFIINCIEASKDIYKNYSLGNPKICSPITRRKIKHEAFMFYEGNVNQHVQTWIVDNICNFEVNSAYSKGGIVAVIQNMNLRKNETNQECIDFIEFKVRKRFTQRFCGHYDAQSIMAFRSPGFSYENAINNTDGVLDISVFIDKAPLGVNERTEFTVIFTSYKDCTDPLNTDYYVLPCADDDYMCINSKYFEDGYINCPFYNCIDEDGCFSNDNTSNPKGSLPYKALVGSLTISAMLFILFTIIIWAFKKHKLFCWSDTFAHPPSAMENNRHSRVMEMNIQTGARLAEVSVNPTQPSAPVEEEKDLPPSYESLFPSAR